MPNLDFDRLAQQALDDSLNDNLKMDEAQSTVNQVLNEQKKKADEEQAQAVRDSQQANKNATADEKEDVAEDVKSEKDVFHREVTHTDTKAQTRGRKATTSSNSVQIRDFPKSLMDMAKKTFPSASNTKALAAFVYANRDISADIDYSDVPEDVIKLASTIEKYKMMQSVDANMRTLLNMVMDIRTTLNDVELGEAWLIYDKGGYNTRSYPSDPSELNFSYDGIDKIISKIETTNDEKEKLRKQSEGRPIK